MAKYTGNGATLSLNANEIAGIIELNIEESVEMLDITNTDIVPTSNRSFMSDQLRNFQGEISIKMDTSESNYPRAGDVLAGIFDDGEINWAGELIISNMNQSAKIGNEVIRNYSVQGNGNFYNIEMTEIISYTYPSALAQAHGTLYYNNHLWILMAGTRTENPVKIDSTDLSNYTGVASSLAIGHDQCVRAKGYIWSPKSTFAILRRTLITDVNNVTDYDFNAEGAGLMANGTMIYDSSTETIFWGGHHGFMEVDISDVDNPSPIWHDMNTPTGRTLSSIHTVSSDETYIYFSFADGTGHYGMCKVKASDPSFGGVTSWVIQEYNIEIGFTDDSVCYGGYIYAATDPIMGHDPVILKIATSNLTEIRRVSLYDNSGIIGCYGVWEQSGLLFAAITTSPGQIKIYDTELNLLHIHTFSSGYDLPNEIIFKDANTMFVTFWGTATLEIMELELKL